MTFKQENVIYLCRCEDPEHWEWFTIYWCNPELCSCPCHDPEEKAKWN